MNNKKAALVILAAGKGSRIGAQAEYLHKSLLPINHQPVLAYILSQFPQDLPVVIAVGHLSYQIKAFFRMAYPDRQVTFVDVPNYDQAGSGPGASLLCCRPQIQSKTFFVTTIDTLILDPMPPIEQNWIGVSSIENPSRFCTVALDGEDRVVSFADKDPETKNRMAFNGVFGVKTPELMWRALESNRSLIGGEVQLSNGLQGLLEAGLHAKKLKWLDTGDLPTYSKARQFYEKESFDYSKTFEQTYVIGNRIVKWFKDVNIAAKRVERAKELAPFVPSIADSEGGFYAYERVEGKTLYECLDQLDIDVLLQWLQNIFWDKSTMAQVDRQEFESASKKFYQLKALERLKTAFEKTGCEDRQRLINDHEVPSINELMDHVPWRLLSKEGIPGRFHGDLQLDNIIFTEDEKQPFVLIDWRQDFGGLNYGDRYYDLAKLNGCFMLSHADIKKGRKIPLEISADGISVKLSDITNDRLIQMKRQFDIFCQKAGYDLNRIEILTALIYLNMSPLHVAPFDIFLIYYGQWRLAKAIGQIK